MRQATAPHTWGGGPKGRRGLLGLTLILAAVFLVWWGWFVLGFLDEPSAVDRVRAALIVIGGGSIVAGFAGAGLGAVMLIVARPSRKSSRT